MVDDPSAYQLLNNQGFGSLTDHGFKTPTLPFEKPPGSKPSRGMSGKFTGRQGPGTRNEVIDLRIFQPDGSGQ
jgi:hypothetical protein